MPNKIAAGFQSSAATDNAVVFNQTNYANIDSIGAGGSANVRIYGAAGPGRQYASVKGPTEKILPSATIINVPYSTNPVVAYDGAQYQVRNTLPEVLTDNLTPIGGVSVISTGGPVVLPTVALVLGTGGAVLGWNVTNEGENLTGPVDLAINTSTGSGATPGAQTIKNGKLISIAPGNPGSNYSGGDTVTVTGGTLSGASGGGRAIGGNGGRLIINDGTTGGATV